MRRKCHSEKKKVPEQEGGGLRWARSKDEEWGAGIRCETFQNEKI